MTVGATNESLSYCENLQQSGSREVGPAEVYVSCPRQLGMARVLVAANVASEGRVQVIVQNLGSVAVDIEPGELRVAITQYG